jgi:hypothetical protein
MWVRIQHMLKSLQTRRLDADFSLIVGNKAAGDRLPDRRLISAEMFRRLSDTSFGVTKSVTVIGLDAMFNQQIAQNMEELKQKINRKRNSATDPDE